MNAVMSVLNVLVLGLCPGVRCILNMYHLAVSSNHNILIVKIYSLKIHVYLIGQ